MKDADIKSALLEVEERIRSNVFEGVRKSFIQKHVDVFTYDDENKLVYSGAVEVILSSKYDNNT